VATSFGSGGWGGEQGHGPFGQVAALAGLPFVAGFDGHRAGQPQQGLGTGEHADDLGVALDLLVQPADRAVDLSGEAHPPAPPERLGRARPAVVLYPRSGLPSVVPPLRDQRLHRYVQEVLTSAFGCRYVAARLKYGSILSSQSASVKQLQ
jgi:hypothetical protein